MDSLYIDPNSSARALDRLQTLRQGPRESFATFLPRFEKELVDSGLRGAGDLVVISYLKKAINNQLGYQMLAVDPINDYPEYVRKLALLSSRYESFQINARQGHAALPYYEAGQHQPRARSPPVEMD